LKAPLSSNQPTNLTDMQSVSYLASVVFTGDLLKLLSQVIYV